MPRSTAARFLAWAALALLAAAAAPAEDATKDDWLVFRGNALQTGVAVSSLPDKLDVLWKFSTGDAIEGAPAVAGGVVFVGSQDEFLYAVDLRAGTEKWKYKAGPVKA